MPYEQHNFYNINRPMKGPKPGDAIMKIKKIERTQRGLCKCKSSC